VIDAPPLEGQAQDRRAGRFSRAFRGWTSGVEAAGVQITLRGYVEISAKTGAPGARREDSCAPRLARQGGGREPLPSDYEATPAARRKGDAGALTSTRPRACRVPLKSGVHPGADP